MRYLKYVVLFGVLLFAAGAAQAQFRVGVGVGPVYGAVGPAPVCAYGYYGHEGFRGGDRGFHGGNSFHGGGGGFHGGGGGGGFHGGGGGHR